MRSHSSLLDESKELLEALANKVKMQRVRNVIAHGQEPRGKMPDPYKDPDAWRKAMNSKLTAGRTAASE